MRKYWHKYRRFVLLLLVFVVIALWCGGYVQAALQQVIGVTYTPTQEGVKVVSIITVVTIAPATNNPPVTLTGDITDAGGSVVTGRGFVWSLTSHDDPGNIPPENTDYEFMWIEEGEFGEGEFYYQPPDLIENTDYHGRAFAINIDGSYYGNEVVFDPIPIQVGRELILVAIPGVIVAGLAGAIFKSGVTVASVPSSVLGGVVVWLIVLAMI